jgi:hypothetical protein
VTVHDELEQEMTQREAALRGLQPYQVRANRAVPDRLIRDLVADARKGISQSASMIPDRQRSEDKPRAPSGGTVEIKPPPGIDIIDRMCEAQSRADRAAAIRQRIENDWIESHFEKGTTH